MCNHTCNHICNHTCNHICNHISEKLAGWGCAVNGADAAADAAHYEVDGGHFHVRTASAVYPWLGTCQVDWTTAAALVVGSEARGLSAAARAEPRMRLVSIPSSEPTLPESTAEGAVDTTGEVETEAGAVTTPVTTSVTTPVTTSVTTPGEVETEAGARRRPPMESLNAAVAGSVILFEAQRQRRFLRSGLFRKMESPGDGGYPGPYPDGSSTS